MKCPKCRYIGFETGDRCRNCGYDFSLLSDTDLSPAASTPGDEPDLDLHHEPPPAGSRAPLDLSLRSPDPDPVDAPATPPALPLFRDDQEAEDEPLVRMAAPRPPIAVRKTPDAQRLRFPRPLSQDSYERDAVFQFGSEPEAEPDVEPEPDPVTEVRQSWGIETGPWAPAAPVVVATASPSDASETDASPLGSRLGAALIDFGLLFGIDVVVIHFTLRLTSLTLDDWRLIPLTPLLIFLVGLKLAYLSAFTLAGGQTIGKMAMGICVVGDDDGVLNLSQAVRRAVVEVASLVAAGVPFLLALTDPARRGLHDRVAHTRVVALS
jgi:resuscitation-promoting factor RpfA